MEAPAIITLVTLIMVILIFATGKTRLDIVALGALLFLFVTGVLTTSEALAGFADPVVIMIASTFVVGQAVVKTGVADMLAGFIRNRAKGRLAMLLAGIMIASSIISAFMSSTGTVAIMLPVTIGAARQSGINPSKILLPMAYATLLGGLLTLIATPPNMIVSSELAANGQDPFGFFAFTVFGVLGLMFCIVFVATVGHRMVTATKDESDGSGTALSPHTAPADALPLTLQAARATRRRRRLTEALLARLHNWRGCFKLKECEDYRATPLHEVVTATSDTSAAEHPPPVPVPTAADPDVGKHTEAAAVDPADHEHHPHPIADGEHDDNHDLDGQLLVEPPTASRQPTMTTMPAAHDDEATAMHLVRARVRPGSSLVNKSLAEIKIRHKYGVSLVAIERGHHRHGPVPPPAPPAAGPKHISADGPPITDMDTSSGGLEADQPSPSAPQDRAAQLKAANNSSVASHRNLLSPRHGYVRAVYVDTVIRSGDLLYLFGEHAAVQQLMQDQLLALEEEEEAIQLPPPLVLAEFIVPPSSPYIGKTLKATNVEKTHAVAVLSVMHGGERMTGQAIGGVLLAPGDIILVSGHQRSLVGMIGATEGLPGSPVCWHLLASYPDGALGTRHPLALRLADRWRIVVTALVLIAMLVVMTGGWLPNAISVLAAGFLLIALGCVSANEAYAVINWESVVLTASMLAVVTALTKTGLIAEIANAVGAVGTSGGPYALLVVLFLLTSVVGLFVSNTATAVLFAPVAYEAALAVGVNPRALLAAVAVASSSSFLTPTSSPVVTLVYGPGHYKFVDYLRLGSVLFVFMFLVTVAFVPLLYPF